jgi:hypothetical protein
MTLRLVAHSRPRSEQAILDCALHDLATRAREAERAGASWEVLCAFLEAAKIIASARLTLDRRSVA